MARSLVISSLLKRRARLAGQIIAQEQQLAKDRVALSALDATLRLIDPANQAA
ncbi:MAG TPA: hypothetical protein VEB64_08450 [Azospirillaceae bacterium]|nr:hypothetical protein [Azospirillaceae bacterium]